MNEKQLVEYYESLLDFIDDNIPNLDSLISEFENELKGQENE